MKRLFIIVFALILSASAVSAQNYKWAEGLAFQPSWYNGGVGIGFDVTQGLKNGDRLDYALNYYFNHQGGEFNLAYEWDLPILTDGLSLYWGPGFGFGAVSYAYELNNHQHTTWSIMGVVGAEYMLKSAPFAFSLDWRPRCRFRTYYNDWYLGLGCFNLAVKIYFL